MTRPLDGLALHGYCRRLALGPDTRELLATIRRAPPNRTPCTRHGNVAVWYPSKKMGRIIKAESAKVEFAFLLEAEHDDAVLEFYDQPPAIPLEYRDRRGRLHRPLHTADYFLFRYDVAGWEECKPTEELRAQAQARPYRYQMEADGTWRCPPGEAFAARFGLTYRVRASAEINWAAQSNWQFLDDYYQDLDHLAVPDEDLATVLRLLDAHPGLTLAALHQAAGVSADLLFTAIAHNLLYVDLATHRLSEPARTPVFRDRRTARGLHTPWGWPSGGRRGLSRRRGRGAGGAVGRAAVGDRQCGAHGGHAGGRR
jgi:putative transposase